MTSLREQIHVRNLAILGSVGLTTVKRNLVRLDDLRLPAGIYHDGDEEAKAEPQAVGKIGNAVSMRPIIELRFSGASDDIGTAGSAWLAKVQSAVLTDARLEILCRGVRPHGARYVGMSFSVAEGRETVGQLTIHFAIACLFNPLTLAEVESLQHIPVGRLSIASEAPILA